MRYPKQKRRVLEHLQEHGSLDPLESWAVLGVYRLAARIQELKDEGYEIQTARQTVTNRHGERVTFARYELAGA